MSTERRRILRILLGLPFLSAGLAVADEAADSWRQKGGLRMAVYNDFPPYAVGARRGIDVELAQALAARLGVGAVVAGYQADEDMNDDLRNMVWKGHYLGTPASDVMLHVPVDSHLMAANDKVTIFAPYHVEQLAVARQPARVGPLSGSAAVALEVFTHEKIGVETATLGDAFLLSVLNGRLRENVVHFRNPGEAVLALQAGQVAAVVAPRGELEGALAGDARFPVEVLRLPELKNQGWALGLAVKRDASALAEALARAMRELLADGTVAAIFRRHGVTHQPPV